MNTILKRKISLSSTGSSKKSRVCKLLISLELSLDDDDDECTDSGDSAIGNSMEELSVRRRPSIPPAPLPVNDPAHLKRSDSDRDDAPEDGDVGTDAGDDGPGDGGDLPADLTDALFNAGLTGDDRTSTDNEHDESAISEASTHDDDPRDKTVRTQDLEFDSEDSTDSDFWTRPLLEREN